MQKLDYPLSILGLESREITRMQMFDSLVSKIGNRTRIHPVCRGHYMVLMGKANHGYKVVDLNEIIESRHRINYLEAKFQNVWKVESKSA